MRRLSAVAALVCLVATVSYAGDPPAGWNIKNDRGDWVHVLPTFGETTAGPSFGNQPVNAPNTGMSVYPASYGFGNLYDRGGLEIANAGFYQVYYGPTVSAALSSGINAFINAFGAGVTDYTIIQQYGSHAPISAKLTNVGSYADPTEAPASMSDAAVQSYLASLFNNSAVPANASTVYGVYLPKGSVSSMGNSTGCGGSNVGYCGYHSHFTWNGIQVKYAVFPYNDCTGCSLTGKTVLDMETIVTSHEIREAVTDPGDNGKNAWYDLIGYEADDKCAWHNLYKMQGLYWVQPEYSNANRGCVVP